MYTKYYYKLILRKLYLTNLTSSNYIYKTKQKTSPALPFWQRYMRLWLYKGIGGHVIPGGEQQKPRPPTPMAFCNGIAIKAALQSQALCHHCDRMLSLLLLAKLMAKKICGKGRFSRTRVVS